MRVLVVDDDADVRRIVRRALELERFQVVEAGSAEEALQSAGAGQLDVAVLDLNLPGMSGLEVVSQLRARAPGLHVIMLTGVGGEADRVRGLVRGADDYVVKPFSPRELAARVIAVGRRRSPAPAETIELGAVRIDLSARATTVDSRPVELTRREFDLLCHLASNPGRAFTRAELLHAVWASSADWQSEATVTEHVRRLRSRIEVDPSNPRWIVTVRGAGYRFDPDGSASSGRGRQDEHEP